MKPDKPKSELVVLGTPIATNDANLYRMNDLHKIAVERGFATKHDTPREFMRRKDTKRLLESIEARVGGNSPTPIVQLVTAGPNILRGSYGHRYMLLAYAASLHGDVYLDAMMALDAAYSQKSGEQLSASQKALRAEKRLNDEVSDVSRAASKLARSKTTVPPLRTAVIEAVAGLQSCFPGFDVTPMIEAAQPKRKRK
jgi:KilA-N domain